MQVCDFNSDAGASMVTFLQIPYNTQVNEDYLTENFAISWESSVLGRKGIIPMKLALIEKPAYSVTFGAIKSTGKLIESTATIKRLNKDVQNTIKVNLMGQEVNSFAFLQSKSIVKIKPGVEEVTIPIKALIASGGCFELMLEFICESNSASEFFKSPHLINAKL